MIPTAIDSLKDLTSGSYGILEPKLSKAKALDINAIDAVIVPGLAFDKSKHRLGRGAGYYDRFLSSLNDRTATIGIAFDFQITQRLPVEQHDIALKHLLFA